MSELVYWNDDYATGNSLIDSDHKKLFALANDVFKIKDPVREKQKVRMCVHALFDYMKIHYANEREYMEKLSYVGMDQHIKQHENTHAEMTNILQSSESITQLTLKLKDLMTRWLFNHIIVEDKKMVKSLWG